MDDLIRPQLNKSQINKGDFNKTLYRAISLFVKTFYDSGKSCFHKNVIEPGKNKTGVSCIEWECKNWEDVVLEESSEEYENISKYLLSKEHLPSESLFEDPMSKEHLSSKSLLEGYSIKPKESSIKHTSKPSKKVTSKKTPKK